MVLQTPAYGGEIGAGRHVVLCGLGDSNRDGLDAVCVVDGEVGVGGGLDQCVDDAVDDADGIDLDAALGPVGEARVLDDAGDFRGEVTAAWGC